MNLVTFLIASLTLIATCCYGIFNRQDELCVELHQEQAICRILMVQAARGDKNSGEFSSVGQRACKQAENLEKTLMEYLESKKITPPNECEYIRQTQGYNKGKKKAAKIVEQIRKGSLEYKILNRFDQLSNGIQKPLARIKKT